MVEGMAPRAAGGAYTNTSKSMGPKAPLWGSKAWLPGPPGSLHRYLEMNGTEGAVMGVQGGAPGPPGNSTPILSRLRWSKGLSMRPAVWLWKVPGSRRWNQELSR